MIASELNFNHTTVYQILTQELAIRELCAKIVPKNLTIERKGVCKYNYVYSTQVSGVKRKETIR